MKDADLRPAARRWRLVAWGTVVALVWLGTVGAAMAASASLARHHGAGASILPATS